MLLSQIDSIDGYWKNIGSIIKSILYWSTKPQSPKQNLWRYGNRPSEEVKSFGTGKYKFEEIGSRTM